MLGIKEDSRNIVERLRRKDLQKILEANNINFDESKTPASVLRTMVEQSNIDVFDPTNGVEYEKVTVENEDGSFHEEIYPVVKPHATANKDIDYDKYINTEKDDQITALQDRINELEAQVVKSTDYSSMKMPQLRKAAKEQGLTVSTSTKKAELVELLNGQNTA